MTDSKKQQSEIKNICKERMNTKTKTKSELNRKLNTNKLKNWTRIVKQYFAFFFSNMRHHQRLI